MNNDHDHFIIWMAIILLYCIIPAVSDTTSEPKERVEPTVDPVLSASLYTANVSAYCPLACCCGDFADGITASGHVIQPGDKFVAAPAKYPFGTLMAIPGYGVVPVLDRGGAIKGDKLDVFFGGPTGHAEALQWGRRYVKVVVSN